MKSSRVILYSKKHCPLCDEALDLLKLFQNDYNFEIEEIDIYTDDTLLEKYQISIPVIEVNGNQLDGSQIDFVELQNLLNASL